MAFPGPAVLGRGVVVDRGQSVPAPFADVERVSLDEHSLRSSRAIVDRLHAAWAQRSPIVVELGVDVTDLRSGEVWDEEPYQLDPSTEFLGDRLHFLLWANNYDLRSGEPIWWWARKAQRQFGGALPGEDDGKTDAGDLTLSDEAVWCDGGPRSMLEMDGKVLHRDAIESGDLRFDRTVAPSGQLAADQLLAVGHQGGPLRVIAPAGSGKTRVLTERLRHLVVDRDWSPGSVCALAYNRRAAEEMVERTSGLNLQIRTLNSVALAIVNGTGGFAAVGPRRSVIEEVDVRRLLENLVEVQHAPNTDPYVPYLDGLRAIRLGLRTPAEVEASFEASGLADAFPRFQAQLDDKGVVDFDGQLYEAIKVLLRSPAARAQAQRQCRHLLVDEFQDLTPAHMLLVRILAGPTFDVFGVGDDDQVIYGFGGATPDFLLKFAEYFPGASATALHVNYRCPPSVIDQVSRLLSYNTKRIDKSTQAAPGRSAVEAELLIEKVAEERTATKAVEVLARWHESGSRYTDMAVLTRVNSTLLPIQVMLSESGVPCRAAVTETILDRTGTRSALAYLRMGLSPDDIRKGDVFETIRRPGRRISRNVVEMITKRPKTSVKDLKRLSDYLSGTDSQKVLGYVNDIEMVAAVLRGGATAEALRCIRIEVGLGDAMETLDGSRREADRSTHADDLLALEQVARLHEDTDTFEPWLRNVLRRRNDEPGVELSTIHRVKGMEWDDVLIFGVDDGLMPHRLSDNEEEERRLLHVAMTRSRRRLALVASLSGASPFLEELDGSRARVPLRRAASISATPAGPRTTSASTAAEPALDSSQQALRTALVSWRREVAKRDGVPPYVVLSNDDVITVTLTAPKSLRELSKCKGIGPIRLERWGDELLGVIEESQKP